MVAQGWISISLLYINTEHKVGFSFQKKKSQVIMAHKKDENNNTQVREIGRLILWKLGRKPGFMFVEF
jgi:hypothetical protein